MQARQAAAKLLHNVRGPAMDTATYTRLKLQNGLAVLVASDPTLHREAACMAIAVGE